MVLGGDRRSGGLWLLYRCRPGRSGNHAGLKLGPGTSTRVRAPSHVPPRTVSRLANRRGAAQGRNLPSRLDLCLKEQQFAHALRKLSVRIGAVVRTVDAYPYSLPKGLPDGAGVTVVSYDLRRTITVVRDAPGREWTIQALQNLDAGSEYMLGGRWLPEDHPLVLAELRKS